MTQLSRKRPQSAAGLSWLGNARDSLLLCSGIVVGILAPLGNGIDLYNKVFNHDPGTRVGTLSMRSAVPGQTWGDYKNSDRPHAYKALEKAKAYLYQDSFAGMLVELSYRIQGYKGVNTPIRWTVYKAGTQTPVSNPTLFSQEGFPSSFVSNTSSDDAGLAEVWIPYPGRSGRYYAKIRLFSSYPPINRLDEVYTPVFTVQSSD